ncbi:hypothetical protein [Streptomyces sp. NPDC048111]|uniref:hypothetical protein n=1 Tax=Streptomyces sp. NPDC048111 TaxID=3365500 RepID=UPI00372452A9
MDATGVAAILALTGIPVSVLVSRWQLRAALRQAEVSHLAALQLAAENHRNALEAVEVNHRNALALARRQAEAERIRWLTEARRSEYRLFESALAQYRRALMAPEPLAEDVIAAFDEVHHSVNHIHAVGPEEVSRSASSILGECRQPAIDYQMGRAPDAERREECWARIRTLRRDFHDEAKTVLEGAPS